MDDLLTPDEYGRIRSALEELPPAKRAEIDGFMRHRRVCGRTGAIALSPRESEVTRLVAAGLSNREIARTLYIGEDTVKKHVSHVLGKLGARNRTELAVFASPREVVG